MGTASRPNPLAFLDEELAALRERNLYRPLRVMSSAQGPIVSIDDRRRHQPLVQRLPGPDPPPADEAGRARGGRAVRGGLRRGADDRRHDDAPRGSSRRTSPTFKHTAAVLTFQSGFAANTGVIPTITGETDLIVSDELNHASIIDGMRLSKAPRKIFRHADVDAPPRGPASRRRPRAATATARRTG